MCGLKALPPYRGQRSWLQSNVRKADHHFVRKQMQTWALERLYNNKVCKHDINKHPVNTDTTVHSSRPSSRLVLLPAPGSSARVLFLFVFFHTNLSTGQLALTSRPPASLLTGRSGVKGHVMLGLSKLCRSHKDLTSREGITATAVFICRIIIILILEKKSVDKLLFFFSKTKIWVVAVFMCMWAHVSRAYDHFNVLRCCRAGMLLMFLRQPRGFSRGLCWPGRHRRPVKKKKLQMEVRRRRRAEGEAAECLHLFSKWQHNQTAKYKCEDDLMLTCISCWKPWYGINYTCINAFII